MLGRKSAFWACVWLTPLLDAHNAESFQPHLELPKGCENEFFTTTATIIPGALLF